MKLKEKLQALFARNETETGGVSTGESAPEMDTDERRVIRFGMLILGLGFGGFLLWAALAPLDEGVPGIGVVGVDSKRKTIQHLRGGIIKEILTREGDKVKQNDVLIRLNETEIKAQFDITNAQYAQMQATEARLIAERNETQEIRYPEELLAIAKTDERVAETINVQSRLFVTRRAALTSEISAMNESIRGLNDQIRGLQSIEKGKRTQISLLNKELESYRSLAEEGFVPRNRLYDLERVVADLSGTMGSDIAQIARARSAISELNLRKLQRQQDFRREVESSLADTQREVASLRDKLTALADEYERTEIRAPISGYVVGMDVTTVGGVIRGGEKLLDIVPEGDILVIEAQIPVNLINKVQVGQLATIHFQIVLAGGASPAIEGKLMQISADRLLDPHTGHPYYSARIGITPKGEEEMRRNKITPQPGMQTDVVILTGERTFLQYLIKPLFSRLALGMKEQ